jgi:RNA processing factor Prp31
MVMQSIALLDKLDKDIILFGKRFRKWYNTHLSELICTTAIMNRENMSERVEQRKIQGFKSYCLKT